MKNIKVSIFGEGYSLISDESEEHIASVARRVDTLMREIAQQSSITDPKRIAVLVALRLASDLKNQESLLEHKYQEYVQLLDRINQELTSVCL